MTKTIRSAGVLVLAMALVLSSDVSAQGGATKPSAFAHVEKLGETRIVVENATQTFGYDMLLSHGFLFQGKNGCVMFQRKLDPADVNEPPTIPEAQTKPQFLIFPKGSRVVLRGSALQVNRKIIRLGEDVYPKLGVAYFAVVDSESLLPWYANIPLSCRPGIGDRLVEISGI